MAEYATLRDKIRAEKEERARRYAGFAALYAQAHEAGMAAGNAVTPTPMHIAGYEPVADGVCGFAWVTVQPATCSFCRWYAKQNPRAGRAYGGGMKVKWVSEFNQSMQRKEAYALAFAAVLNAAGINAYADNRMD